VFVVHHVAFSVSDLEASIGFYRGFGFEPGVVWAADDGSLRIAHLRLGGFTVELFCYAGNSGRVPVVGGVGNDLEVVGVKHLGLRVRSLEGAREYLVGAGFDPGTPIRVGRTGLEYFFVRDPDGIWLEIVRDDRGATPGVSPQPGE
jgi:catechol 2,3-dioxygenase-like lactoylglutathione lyase family enzyme